jgi:DNA (cytosine-5)-methyltransferase 1
LTILKKFRPAAFVMENVRGILSSKIGGKLIFPKIIEDLQRPGGPEGPRYHIVPLMLSPSEPPSEDDGERYILKAEQLGVPQARHRIILLGLAAGIDLARGKTLTPLEARYSVTSTIGGLPILRSVVTDSAVNNWQVFARELLISTASVSNEPGVADLLRNLSKTVRKGDPGPGGRWQKKTKGTDRVPAHLEAWLLDSRLDGILNHEVREHMSEDLMRYAFASAFAKVRKRSPKGAKDFPSDLHPKHKNWKSGKFMDRFKVQRADHPSLTMMSHLSKDGHYYIHPDPSQLRSLSVREAARLQTFPDNYFFEGPRSAQFHQVGNAVPPWMARQIAEVVHSYLAT